MTTDAIKSMKLYSGVERIYNDLAALGVEQGEPIDAEQLAPFDNLHYHGTEAVDRAIEALGISSTSRVLDVGAGFGGPARHIARTTGARVTAVELQADLHTTAEDLTARTGLADQIAHVKGDILSTPLKEGAHDAVVSWLALYHIADRAPLFPRLYKTLTEGGGLFVEDLYKRGDFTEAEQADLDGMLYANTLPTRDAYLAELEAAGFTSISFEDQTADWTAFCVERLTAFRAARARHLDVHGPEIVAALDAFYETIVRLLKGGNLGGVRIVARRS